MQGSREQGWRSGESARLPPMWPGFDSRTRRHMWVEFVVGSRPCSERFFSGYSGFPLSSKTNISKFKFDLNTVEEEPPSGSTANPYLFILFILFMCRKSRGFECKIFFYGIVEKTRRHVLHF